MTVLQDVQNWIYAEVVPLVARICRVPSHTIFSCSKVTSHADARALLILVMSNCVRCRNLGHGVRQYHIEELGQPALPNLPFVSLSAPSGWCRISSRDMAAIMRMGASSVRNLRDKYSKKHSITVVTIPDLQKISLSTVPLPQENK